MKCEGDREKKLLHKWALVVNEVGRYEAVINMVRRMRGSKGDNVQRECRKQYEKRNRRSVLNRGISGANS